MPISIKKNQEIKHLLDLDKPRMLFFLLIKVEMPTAVGISTLMRRKKSYSADLSIENFLYPWGQFASLDAATIGNMSILKSRTYPKCKRRQNVDWLPLRVLPFTFILRIRGSLSVAHILLFRF